MSLIRIQRKGAVTLPISLRNRLGLNTGDLVDVKLKGATTIVITPQIVIDRSQFPNAGDEYTPAQRRAIDREIAQSEKEYKQGRGFGPFTTYEELVASLHKESGKLSAKKTKRPVR